MLCPHVSTVAPPVRVHLGKIGDRGKDWKGLGMAGTYDIGDHCCALGWPWQGQHGETGMKYPYDKLH
jgi:hypothetical protein